MKLGQEGEQQMIDIKAMVKGDLRKKQWIELYANNRFAGAVYGTATVRKGKYSWQININDCGTFYHVNRIEVKPPLFASIKEERK